MRRCCATWRVSCVALVALLLLSVCATAAHAASASYTLQRRLGSAGAWQTVTTFALKQKRQLPPRLVVPSSVATTTTGTSETATVATTTLSRDNKSALVAADVVYYRVIPVVDGDEDAQDERSANATDAASTTTTTTTTSASVTAVPVAMLAVTPCTLIRGFDAVDSRTVVLREQLKVVPGAGVGVIGLQVSSSTNMFHSKMLNGDECDRSIVERLFPVVRMVTEVGVVRPVEPVTVVRYDDLRLLSGGATEGAGNGGAAASRRGGGRGRVAVRKVRNAKGEMVEEEVPVDERSFLQKYWVYIVVGVGMTVMRSIKG